MMIISKGQKFILILLLIASISLTICFGINNVLKPKNVDIIFDNKFSEKLKTSLRNKIESYDIKNVGARNIFNDLKKISSGISTVSIAYNAPHKAKILLELDNPKIYIEQLDNPEKTFIITQNGNIAPKTDFDDKCLEHLERIIISAPDFDNQLLNKEMPMWATKINKINNNLFENYNVSWNSEHEILLQSKSDNNLLIVTECNCKDLDKKLNLAQKIYESKRDNKNKFRLDIRYKDFLVYAPGQEVKR